MYNIRLEIINKLLKCGHLVRYLSCVEGLLADFGEEIKRCDGFDVAIDELLHVQQCLSYFRQYCKRANDLDKKLLDELDNLDRK